MSSRFFSTILFLTTGCLVLRCLSYDWIRKDVNACGESGVCDCSEVGFVDCSDRNLFALPQNIPRNTSKLSLARNHISNIPYKFMTQFERLFTLNVELNEIKHPFQLPKNLRELSGGINKLTSIEAFFENGCGKLRLANLTKNQVTTIRDGTFEFGCKTLNHLIINRNLLRKITSKTFKGLTGIRILRIDENPIEIIESEAFSDVCRNLERLLAKNLKNLTTIPYGLFRSCHYVNEIYFTACNLKTLPENTFLGIEEVKLSVSNNPHLSELPESMFLGVKYMHNSGFDMNNLTFIPGNIFSYMFITGEINLGFNHFTTLPAELFRSPNQIEHLLLQHNKITWIPPGFFQYLPFLKVVLLFGNKIENLVDGMFSGTRLQQIFLFRNKITAVEGEPFKTGSNATVNYLDLRDNPISRLSSKSMISLASNATVHLMCDSVVLPNRFKDLTMLCASHGEVINILIVGRSGLQKALGFGGFLCENIRKTELRMINCSTCPTGTYAHIFGGGCTPCPAGGFYQDEVGTFTEDRKGVFCKHCNPGTYVPFGEGNSSTSCQVCPDGTNKQRWAGFRACYCLKNHYRVDRFGKCHVCTEDGLECLEDFVTIRSGYFWDWGSSNLESYKTFVENLQVFDESYDNKTTMFNGTLPKVHLCPVKKACVNNVDNLAGNCLEGYHGWQCTVCENGYHKVFGRCRKCTSTWWILPKLLLFAAFLAAFVRVIITQSRVPQIPESIISGPRLANKIISRGKIVIGFYQVVSHYWYYCGTLVWSPFLQTFIWDIMKILSISLTSILFIPGCFRVKWNAHIQLNVVYIAYVSFFATLVFIYGTLRMVKYQYNECSLPPLPVLKAYFLKMLVVALFLTYTETCTTIFQQFRCDSFFLDQNENKSIRLLHADYTISCDSASHTLYLLMAMPLLIFIVFFPVVLFIQLRKRSKVQLAGNLHFTECPAWVYFLCENYRAECWYWDVVELLRKFLLNFVPMVFRDEGFATISGLSLSVFFICIHIHMDPFKDKTDNGLQLISLLLINFNMSIAASSLSDDDDGVVVIYFISISLLNIGFLILVIGTEPVLRRCGLASRSCTPNNFSLNTQEMLSNSEMVPSLPEHCEMEPISSSSVNSSVNLNHSSDIEPSL